jgi:hypothetical protein
MASKCLTDDALLLREAAFVKPARAELEGPLASVVDVWQITGQLVTGSLTAWVTGADQDVEHVAGATSAGDLVVFYSSPRSRGWQVVNASREAGRTVVGPFASCITRDGEYTVGQVAARGPGGELLVFYWSPRHGRWRVIFGKQVVACQRVLAERLRTPRHLSSRCVDGGVHRSASALTAIISV